jgi:hypothetical protein
MVGMQIHHPLLPHTEALGITSASLEGVIYHQASYVNYKELFNHRQAILRNHIERAIGVLKKRFPILKVDTFHPIQHQIKIAVDVAFHNIIRGKNGEEGWLDHQPYHISLSQYVEVLEGDDNYPNDMDSSDGSNLRDQIAPQMWVAYNS